jgi:RNA polymerase sigma-70 factor (ECF subfamily)
VQKEGEKRGLLLQENNSGPSDEELMANLARGNTDQLGELYLRHGNSVLRFISAALINASRFEAEDICHEVFLTVYEKAPFYQETGKFRSWLFGIAAHKARSAGRRQLFRRNLLEGRVRNEAQLTAAPENKPDEILERRQRIASGLSKLTADQREVLLLKTAQGLSGDEIAAALGITENAVWSRLKRANHILRMEIKRGK